MGQYSFNGIENGTYYIVFDTTARYLTTTPFQGSPVIDSDIDNSQAPGSTNLFTLTNGTKIENIDAG